MKFQMLFIHFNFPGYGDKVQTRVIVSVGSGQLLGKSGNYSSLRTSSLVALHAPVDGPTLMNIWATLIDRSLQTKKRHEVERERVGGDAENLKGVGIDNISLYTCIKLSKVKTKVKRGIKVILQNLKDSTPLHFLLIFSNTARKSEVIFISNKIYFSCLKTLRIFSLVFLFFM